MKVAIIGAGLAGLTTAYYLQQRGAEVTVIDRAQGVGLGASHANAAILTPGMSDPWNAPGAVRKMISFLGRDDAPILLRGKSLPSLVGWGWRFLYNSSQKRFESAFERNANLARYSLTCLDALERDACINYHGARNGTFKLCRHHDSLLATERVAQIGARFGISYSRLKRDEAIALEPSLLPIAHLITGGIYHPDDGSGDAFLFLLELERLCRTGGVNFRLGVTNVSLRAEGKLVRTMLGNDSLETDAIVIAGGIGSAELLRQIRIGIPIAPVKGYSITIRDNKWVDRPKRPVIDNDLHIAITPLGDTLRIAGSAEFAGTDTSLPLERVANLKRLFRSTFPTYPLELDDNHLSPWTGFRPTSPDGVPMIGATRYPNLYVNTGHGHLGWTQAAGSGRALADLITGASPEINLRDYEPRRFGRI